MSRQRRCGDDVRLLVAAGWRDTGKVSAGSSRWPAPPAVRKLRALFAAAAPGRDVQAAERVLRWSTI